MVTRLRTPALRVLTALALGLMAGCGDSGGGGTSPSADSGTAPADDASPGGEDGVRAADDASDGPEATDGADVAPADAGPEAPPAPCPGDQVHRTDGTCKPVGPAGCADAFLDAEGRCRPSLDACPPGTTVVLAEGCVPVGPEACAEIFLDADGLCRPAADACAPGELPLLAEGCVPVGATCAGELAPGADGICDPTATPCPEGHAAVPSVGCLALDPPDGCGEAPWGDLPDGPGVLHVDASAVGAHGDGSRAKPLGTLAEALEEAGVGDTIVLAAGTYVGAAVSTNSVTIRGRCASMVTVGAAFAGAGAFTFYGALGAHLSDVRLSGPGTGITANNGATVTLERVHVAEAGALGLWIEGAGTTVSGTDVLVEQTQPIPEGYFGRGLEIDDGATLELSRCSFSGNRDAGVFAHKPGTSVALTDCTILDTQPMVAESTWGTGFQVRDGATATLDGVVIADNHAVGVSSVDPGTLITVTSSTIVDTDPAPVGAGSGGQGVLAAEDGAVVVVDSVLARNSGQGAAARFGTPTLELVRTLVLDTQAVAGGGSSGWGVEADDDSVVTVTDSAILDNQDVGVVAGNGAALHLTGSIVAGTRVQPGTGEFGTGLVSAYDATLTATDVALVGNVTTGVDVYQSAEATLSRVVIADTQPDGEGRAGHGVRVYDLSTLSLDRVAAVDNHDVGLVVATAGAELIVDDSLVLRTHLVPADDTGGYGVVSTVGALASLTGTTIAQSAYAAMLTSKAATLTGAELLIEHTAVGVPQDEVITPAGVIVVKAGAATLSDSALMGNAAAGVTTSDADASLSLLRVVIADTVSVDDKLGRAASGADGATLEVADSVLTGSPEFDLFLDGSGAMGTVTDTLVDAAGADGAGMWMQIGADMDVVGCEVRGHLGAGVAALTGNLTVTDTRIHGVRTTDIGYFLGIGDGVMTTQAVAHVDGVVSTDNARAGLIFQNTAGSVTGGWSIGNVYGLVVQGSPAPDVGDDLGFEGNQTDTLDDGGLDVPDEPVEVPQWGDTP